VRDSPGLPSALDLSYNNQRSVPRYTFSAVSEITENTTQACVMGRIAEISRKGCYLDVLNPFPEGTFLNVVISRDHGSFVTKAKVLYAHYGLGMGVVFLEPTDDQLEILDSWLAECPPTTRL
jgi:hypothetical protein